MQIRIVLTGGPSAGKTTLLDLLAKQFGRNVAVAPEAASILFRGGYPRPQTSSDVLHTQRAIFTLQRELEAQAIERTVAGAPLFCDRGSIDGCAYWPGTHKEFFLAMGTTQDREFARYSAVIHLQAAEAGRGYSNNDVRTETPDEAAALDHRIGEGWGAHPNYFFIPNQDTFIAKLNLALRTLKPFLPEVERDVPELSSGLELRC